MKWHTTVEENTETGSRFKIIVTDIVYDFSVELQKLYMTVVSQM